MLLGVLFGVAYVFRMTVVCLLLGREDHYPLDWHDGGGARTVCLCAGAIIAALTDLTFNLYGYAAVIANNFLTALYLIMVKTTPSSSGLTTTGLLFYNSALSLPLLGVALAVSREPAGVLAFPRLHSISFQVHVYSAVAGLACICILRGCCHGSEATCAFGRAPTPGSVQTSQVG